MAAVPFETMALLATSLVLIFTAAISINNTRTKSNDKNNWYFTTIAFMVFGILVFLMTVYSVSPHGVRNNRYDNYFNRR